MLLQNIIEKMQKNESYEMYDDFAKFMLCFRYDTMHIFHKILGNIEKNKNSEEYSDLCEKLIKII